MIPALGVLTSLVFLYIGCKTGDPFLLIAALFAGMVAVSAIDPLVDRFNRNASDEINHTGSFRVGYEEDR